MSIHDCMTYTPTDLRILSATCIYVCRTQQNSPGFLPTKPKYWTKARSAVGVVLGSRTGRDKLRRCFVSRDNYEDIWHRLGR